MLLRWSFSLSLIFVGLTHYMQIDSFQVMVADGLGPFAPLGTLWAYTMPGLFILGGLLLLIGQYMNVGTWAVGIALGSIPVGMLLKPIMSGVGLSDAMPPAVQALIWLIVFMWVVKCGGCGCGCGTANCDCGTDMKSMMKGKK